MSSRWVGQTLGCGIVFSSIVTMASGDLRLRPESARCARVAIDSPFPAGIPHFEEQCWMTDEQGRDVRFSLDERGQIRPRSFTFELQPSRIPPTKFRFSSLLRTQAIAQAARELPLRIDFNLPQVGQQQYAAAKQPYRGYWFPFRENLIARDDQSPLAKFDKWVSATHRLESKAAEWERQHHVPSATDWNGHCNGWAAASLLYDEPTGTVNLPELQLSLTPFDLKGILSSASFCVRFNFYGQRYNGKPEEDRKDIPPVLFHQVLVNELGNRKRALAIDTDSGPEVWNYVVSRVDLNTQKVDEHNFRVRAQLLVHTFDEQLTNAHGTAPTFSATYDYTLKTDEQGKIIGGDWLSANPDFLWVPLEPFDCGDDFENPYVKSDLVAELLGLMKTSAHPFRPILVE